MKLIEKFEKEGNSETDFYGSLIKHLMEDGYTDWAIAQYVAKMINVMEKEYA